MERRTVRPPNKHMAIRIAAMALLLISLRYASSGDLILNLFLHHTVPLLQAEELRTNLYEHTPVVILDARSKGEYDVSHLSGAAHVDPSELDMSRLSRIPRSAKIVLYCSVGVRSEKLGEVLKKAGYSHVWNLDGGIFGWVNKGYPVFDSSGNQTSRIHGYNWFWGLWLSKGEKVYG